MRRFSPILISAALVILSTAALPQAAAAAVSQAELDQAWALGAQLKAIADQSAQLTERRRADEAALQTPYTELSEQMRLLNTELASIRNIYRGDRAALAVIDGKATGPSNAQTGDVARAAAIRAEVAALGAQRSNIQEQQKVMRAAYAEAAARLNQAKAQVDLEIRRLKQPYTGDRAALAEIDTKLMNAQGQQTSAQIAEDRAAQRQAAAAQREAERNAPGLQAIADAQSLAPSQLLGPFEPKNEFEQDILTAALLQSESMLLKNGFRAGDAVVQARLQEIQGTLTALNQKHAASESGDHPFTTNWYALSKLLFPGTQDEKLIKPIRKLYAPLVEAQKSQERQAAVGGFFAAIIGFINTIFWLAVWVGGGYLVYRYFKHRKGRDKRVMDASNKKAIEAMGATETERSKRIDEVFDKRSDTLSFETNHKMGGGFLMKCEIIRSIAAMQPREREALRTAYHMFNIDEMTWNNFYWIRMALIYGDGKGQLIGNYRMTGYGESATEAIRKYMDPVNAEGAVTLALNHLAKVAERKPDHPVIKKLAGKLMSGGSSDGGLASTEQFRAAQAAANQPGAILGDAEDAGETLKYTGEGSMITVAPPGSGKTQCHVFPTLLTWPGPAVVLDVKGEIYAGTSKWRAENVGPVYKFSPLDPNNSHCYNPLTIVRSDPDYLWEDARFLADMMMVPTGAKDPFWENRARDVLTAAIARACLEEDPTKRPIGQVMDIFHGLGWDSFVRALQARVDIPSMSRAGNSLSGMDAKTRDGVLQTGLSSLSAWDGDRIARATKRSDWSPLDLRSGKNPTVYICLKPNEVESYISVLRVFIAQHIRQLTTELPPRDALPILFVLDELPRLRQMPPVEEALEIGRQYGIKLWMFTQSVGQLQNAYPNADGMIGSCAVRMYMNPSLHDGTAQKISDDIGMQESVLDGTRQKIVEPNTLAGPEYKDFVIVMAAGMKPMRLKKHFAYKDEDIRGRMGSL